ncbi:MAG: exo-alpha-sialidase [Planctomycetaceae bacterium]|nr:exo-alpha-sialidase [Planctomycetaceae bacterium]
MPITTCQAVFPCAVLLLLALIAPVAGYESPTPEAKPTLPLESAPMLTGDWVPADTHRIDFNQLPRIASEHVVISDVHATGGVNQHNYLVHHAGRFWVMWSDGPGIEDRVGQRVKYATSRDGRQWSMPRDLTPSPPDSGPDSPYYNTRDARGSRWISRGFWQREGQLLALASLDEAAGFFGKSLALHAFRYDEAADDWGHVGIVHENAINNFPPRQLSSGEWMMSRRTHDYKTTGVHFLIGGTSSLQAWASVPVHGSNSELAAEEPLWWELPDKRLVALFRDNRRGGFLYRSFSSDQGRTWSEPARTNFPDATSKLHGLRLSDGRYVLVSNTNPKRRDPLTIAVSRDGLEFDKLGYLVGGRHVDYPHVLEQAGRLYVAFAGKKQTVELLSFPLEELENLPDPVGVRDDAAKTTLRVLTDFEGGSARVLGIDQDSRTIRLMPGGDPARGWNCWWSLRVEGVPSGETLTLELSGSDLPTRNNGLTTNKPLDASWSLPARAAYSSDESNWRQTEPGERSGAKIRYRVTGTGDRLWIAWGPSFTPQDTTALLNAAHKTRPTAQPFELARTRGDLPVMGLRVRESPREHPPVVWVQARQHAWESGSSWVAQGFVEWLVSDDNDATWLRSQADVYVIPIMDVDNVITGNGGKEADPRDHNRDWDDQPVYPEVAATQRWVRAFAAENRLHVFLDLHNPAPGDHQPFFFLGPDELLPETGRVSRRIFLEAAKARINGPLKLADKPRITGPGYHPLWKQISCQWVNAHGNPHTMAACLETSWNTPQSTTVGYRQVGRQLGQATTDLLRRSLPSE